MAPGCGTAYLVAVPPGPEFHRARGARPIYWPTSARTTSSARAWPRIWPKHSSSRRRELPSVPAMAGPQDSLPRSSCWSSYEDSPINWPPIKTGTIAKPCCSDSTNTRISGIESPIDRPYLPAARRGQVGVVDRTLSIGRYCCPGSKGGMEGGGTLASGSAGWVLIPSSSSWRSESTPNPSWVADCFSAIRSLRPSCIFL